MLALLKETGKRFICQVSPETALDQESIDLLASSGCTLVGVGLESISNNSLQFLGKIPVKDPGEVIKRIQDADMGCYLNMIFGSDGETPGIFKETLRFLEETRPAVVSPHILTPYPGTTLYNSIGKPLV